MIVWKLQFDVDRFDNLVPAGSITGIPAFDGSSRTASWQPIRVVRMEPEKHLALGDAPGFAAPIFSKQAVELLRPLIGDSAEILPLICDEGEFFAVNVVNILDAVDYEQSEYKTFSDGKRIMRFIKYAFYPEKIKREHVFKIPDETKRNFFVSDDFKKTVEENRLKGFVFIKVWEG